jgi:hypothetical protein
VSAPVLLKLKTLEADNSRLRAALQAALLVLAGQDLNKDALIRALEQGRTALKGKS